LLVDECDDGSKAWKGKVELCDVGGEERRGEVRRGEVRR
jgi:hypothetical protein